MAYVYQIMPSPVGALRLVAGPRGLVGVLWPNDGGARVPHCVDAVAVASHPTLDAAAGQLAAYFAGERRNFALPLDFVGAAFAQRVWRALCAIPYGETRTYGQLAAELGAPGAARAVGLANGRNPLSIVAPCHRVVGTNGKLTGFAGGLAAKAFLLALEARHASTAGLPLWARLDATAPTPVSASGACRAAETTLPGPPTLPASASRGGPPVHRGLLDWQPRA